MEEDSVKILLGHSFTLHQGNNRTAAALMTFTAASRPFFLLPMIPPNPFSPLYREKRDRRRRMRSALRRRRRMTDRRDEWSRGKQAPGHNAAIITSLE